MDRDPDERPHSGEGVDGFEAIVSGLRGEGGLPEWPDDGVVRPYAPAPAPADDDHFVPPEPPPLPRIGPPAAVGLGLLLLGFVLVAAPGWVGVSASYGLPLGLLTLAAGLGWLVLRLWPSPPGPGDRDDGAVL
ncbi:hypothetical protein [Pseudonocardia sp.]|uniref:hypothetical protein n=1 Tax=Pseudonocardia sp. TaxID=60912 RepID=UPI00263A0348|nr:hypothetical protein [Pseudonocardia sp.]